MIVNPHVDALLGKWRERATQARELFFTTRTARVIERCVTDLEKALELDANQLLTLDDASEASGYSKDHLGRLVRQGKIPQAGRSGAPLIRRSDLPIRAAASQDGVAPELNSRYRPSARRRIALLVAPPEKEA